MNNSGYITEFKEYEHIVSLTDLSTGNTEEEKFNYALMGLSGEVGEICNKFKKVLRGDKLFDDEFKQDMIKEIGDVLWYLSSLSDKAGVSLKVVANQNANKLLDRLERNKIKGDGDNR